MALIKCPECGKEISDKAESCPQCGMPIKEIKAMTEKTNLNTPNTNSTSQSKKEKNGMPPWLWVLIIVGSLLVVCGIVLLCLKGKSPSSNADQEEGVAQISYPNITSQGVEPFTVGSSMYDFSAKGDFYDTIFIEKRYNAFEENGEIHYDGLDEEGLKKVKKEWGDIFIVKSYGYAYVIKDNDTLIKMDYDENAVIHSIEVMSEQIKMQNGVHVGLSATEMFEKHNALFITPSSYNSELGESGMSDDAIFELPHQPANITVNAFYDKIDFDYKGQYEIKQMEAFGFSDYDTLPLEAVKGCSVRSIIIKK